MSSSRGGVLVRDCMRHGILSCRGDAAVGELAAIMARNRVHAVAVTDGDTRRIAAVASDLDVIGAAASGSDATALQVASRDPLTISANAPVGDAARKMIERHVSHLVVVDAASGYPIGIVSTLDLAAVYADDAS